MDLAIAVQGGTTQPVAEPFEFRAPNEGLQEGALCFGHARHWQDSLSAACGLVFARDIAEVCLRARERHVLGETHGCLR